MAVRDLRAAPAACPDSGQRGGATRFHPGPGLHLGAAHRRTATQPGRADNDADDHADHADNDADLADDADLPDVPDQSYGNDGTQRPGRTVRIAVTVAQLRGADERCPVHGAGNIRAERGAPRDADSGFSTCRDSGGSSAVAGGPADYTGVP
jgi:hypothetical protein